MEVLFAIAHIIKKLKDISKYKPTDNGTFVYGEGSDAVVVPVEIHALVQSPEIAERFSKVITGPMKTFKRPSREIEIKIAGSKASEDAISFLQARRLILTAIKTKL